MKNRTFLAAALTSLCLVALMSMNNARAADLTTSFIAMVSASNSRI
jgi:hypothetical protein